MRKALIFLLLILLAGCATIVKSSPGHDRGKSSERKHSEHMH